MGRYRSIMIVAIVLVSMVSMGVGLVGGQTESGQYRQQGNKMNCQSRFDQMDANQDGMVTQDEFAAASHARRNPQGGFAARDTDHDGSLSVSEYCAGNQRNCQNRFNQMDADHDGLLTKDEFKAAPRTRRDPQQVFVSKDADGSGSLTVNEFCSGRRRGMAATRTQ